MFEIIEIELLWQYYQDLRNSFSNLQEQHSIVLTSKANPHPSANAGFDPIR